MSFLELGRDVTEIRFRRSKGSRVSRSSHIVTSEKDGREHVASSAPAEPEWRSCSECWCSFDRTTMKAGVCRPCQREQR